jgi:hypothetical protein
MSMLALIAVDCGCEPRLGQTKDYKKCICCFSAARFLIDCDRIILQNYRPSSDVIMQNISQKMLPKIS